MPRVGSPQARTLLLVLLALSLPGSARAALGSPESSIDADRVHMKGALLGITRTNSYTLHEMQSASGTVVREYVSPAGVVFGVAWQGAWMPDLENLLGSYFPEFQQAAQAARAKRKGRGPLTIRTNQIVVQMYGHARAFSGTAYATPLVPQGVGVETIR